jgi:hypothetical protein
VIFREWPKKRFTQKYSHSCDPSEMKMDWKEFMHDAGIMENKIKVVFGVETLEKIQSIIKEQTK